MAAFEVYSRRGCHLCEDLIEALLEQARGQAAVVVHDVDSRADWREHYGSEVPVVTWAGRELCRHRLDEVAVTRVLAALP